MIEISSWMDKFVVVLEEHFGDRVWFVGLQGSYGRGEASETSDIDVVVILDELTAQDIQAYNAMLDTLPNRELICGFVSGKKELLNWEPSDLFQFYHDTTPIKGSLDELLVLIDDDAIVKTDKGAVTWFVNKISHKHEDWFGEIPEPKFHFSNEEKRVEIKILTEEEIKRINEEYLKTLVK